MPLSEIKLSIPPAKSTLDRDVLIYVLGIFDNYIEEHDSNKQITEKDLLNGASNWSEYSWGGSSLIYDEDICKRLSTPSEQKKTRYGERSQTLMKNGWMYRLERSIKQLRLFFLSQIKTLKNQP